MGAEASSRAAARVAVRPVASAAELAAAFALPEAVFHGEPVLEAGIEHLAMEKRLA